MLIKVSNTGKTITLTFPKEQGNKRYIVEYQDGLIRLTPATNEMHAQTVRASSGCITMTAASRPHWPVHELLNLEFMVYEDGSLAARMPKNFATNYPKNTRRHLVSPTELPQNEAVKPVVSSDRGGNDQTANVVLTINEKAYSFSVPADQLLDLVMSWATTGYARN